MILKQELNSFLNLIIRSDLFTEMPSNAISPPCGYKIIHLFELRGTKFCLEILTNNENTYNLYYNPSATELKIFWVKRGFLCQDYEFFEMVAEVPEPIQVALLFHFDILRKTDQDKYKFRK